MSRAVRWHRSSARFLRPRAALAALAAFAPDMPFAPVARAQGTGGAAACFPAGVDTWHHGDRLGGVDHDWRYTNLGVTYGLGSAT